MSQTDLPSFETFAKAADYLKAEGVGSSCILSPARAHSHVLHSFREKAMLVLAPTVGPDRRRITFKTASARAAVAENEIQSRYVASHRNPEEPTFSQILDEKGLAVGETLSVKGNRANLRRVAAVRFGPGNVSICKDGTGWRVTRKA